MNRGRMAVFAGQGGTPLDSGSPLSVFNASLRIISDDAYILSEADSGYYLVFTSDDPVTLTIPYGMAYEVENAIEVGIVQWGAGAVSPTPAEDRVSVTAYPADHAATAGRGAVASLLCITPNAYLFGGNTAAV